MYIKVTFIVNSSSISYNIVKYMDKVEVRIQSKSTTNTSVIRRQRRRNWGRKGISRETKRYIRPE